MPFQRPGRGKQDYSTPPEFLTAVKRLLGIEHFVWDLAASTENTVVPGLYCHEHDDSLKHTWHGLAGWSWLNPPYANIAPWVEKAYRESWGSAKIAMLVPASVGANWWLNWVHYKAMVLFLNGRLTFVGQTQPYPKDCALLLYGAERQQGWDSYCVWKWRDLA